VRRAEHFETKFLTEPSPKAIIFGVHKERCNEIDVADIHSASWSDQKIGPTICKWKFGL